jgi:hypothetical protein
MDMRGTGIEKEAEICDTNKTKCMSTSAKKWGKKFVNTYIYH